ncbi:carbohydrate ABC transporter permease [Mesorhizobium sp. NZP2077]|uniref:carbohydrate ABC transporter permease n=1 Tax=Mesorhizobium sp. NZP2077 TaxID=2483404 RepID=UPI001557E846|nr:carbohydrate ABC transporter permease [Mesorhizobium sp. NZP2077]QKC85380.1 carbohydrate ABC transporter permease [Mesorhizobium sp. NZP2077]QKD19019.1 carbohydrate ABC transporter permease [Mesorhizobium sp. NZP2077]
MTVAVRAHDFDAIARRERARQAGGWIIVAVAALVSLVWLTPFYYLLVSVFKSNAEYGSGSPLALPQGFSPIIDNALRVWTDAKLGWGLANSATYGLIGASVAVLIAAMASFGLTRLDFSGRTFWFMLIFSGTVFPFQMYLIPLFFTYQKIGILNTRFGMILFYTAICVPFPVLVLRNFMAQLNPEMDEAARMDGANDWRVFFSIVLPNCRGPMLALFLLQFTWIWNDLLFSTVLGNTPEIRSVMNALQIFQGSYTSSGPNIVLTGALMASIPTVLLFFLLRRHFMAGLGVST